MTAPIIWNGLYAKLLKQLKLPTGTTIEEDTVLPIGVTTRTLGSVILHTPTGTIWVNVGGVNWERLAGSSELIARYPTVVSVELSTYGPGSVIYCEETQTFYTFILGSTQVRDGDIVLDDAAASGKLLAINRPVNKNNTGWIDRNGATLSITGVDSVRLALSSQATFSCKGIRNVLPAANYDITITGASGLKYLYFDCALTLKSRDTFWEFETETPVGIAYWSGGVVVAAQTEYHTAGRNLQWHLWAHYQLGAQYKSGLEFTGNRQTDNNTDPGVDTVQYLWSTTGSIVDEDVEIPCGTGQWLQTLGSGLTSATAAIFKFWYFNGTIIVPNAAMADRSPFIYSGANGTPMWNNAGTMQASVTGNYVVYHYFASPLVDGFSVYARPHIAVFTSLAAAQAARPSQLTWTSTAEVRHLYTAIWRVNTGWTEVTHRCKLVSLQDFRQISGSPVTATATTSHSALSGRDLTLQHPIGSVYGTTNGRIPYHSDTAIGLTDSADLTWDIVNSRLGIRTLAPACGIHVATTVTSSPRGIMSSQHSTGVDGARIHGRKSRGTNASPTVIVSGDMLTRWVGSGYDGANYLEMASIDFVSSGTIASTRVPTDMIFNTATDAAPSILTERMRITNAGRIGIGLTAPATEFQVATSSTSSPRGIMSSQHNTGTDGARIHGRKSRGTAASPTVIVSGDMLTRWVGSGYDGANYLEMASIDFVSSGTIASTRVPTDMIFNTATDAAPSVLTERMRITNTGTVGIGCTPDYALEVVGNIAATGVATPPLSIIRRNNGTRTSPTAILSTESLGALTFNGQYDSTVGHFAIGAYIDTYATANWTSSTVHPVDMLFFTSPASGAAAERMRILSEGDLKRGYGIRVKRRQVTASETILDTDECVECNHASTPIIETLLTAVGREGKRHTVTRTGLAAVRVACAGTETISGSNFIDLPNQWSSVTFYSDNTQWIII